VTKFADFKGTKFVPYLLTIIPKGEPLSENSSLTPEKLGKIPGRRLLDGRWEGFAWQEPTYNTDAVLDAYDRMYAHRRCATIGFQGREFAAVDADITDPLVGRITQTVASRVFGAYAPRRIRDGSEKFLLMYRRADDSPPIMKRVLRVRNKLAAKFLGDDTPVEVIEFLGAHQQWLYSGEHPDGSTYYWEEVLPGLDYSPLGLGWDNMPTVNAEQADRFMTELAQALDAGGYEVVKASLSQTLSGTRHPIENHPDAAADLEMLGRALACIPIDCDDLATYDEWFRMLVALKAACRGDEAFYDEHVEPWSNGNPDNAEDDLTRQKWESIRDAEIGASFVYDVARKVGGFEGYIASHFDVIDDSDVTIAPPPVFRGDPESHSQLADKFEEGYGRVALCYVPELDEWRQFIDGVWEKTDTALSMISELCRQEGGRLWPAAKTAKQQDRIRTLFNVHCAKAVETLLKARSGMMARKREFDRHRYLIGVPGGYIDKEGQLQPPDPSLFISRRAKCGPDYGAEAPRFVEMVRRLANYDDKIFKAIRRAIGYTLCGTGAEQAYFFLLGDNGNEGKSQLLRALYYMLGDYATRVETQTFLRVNGDRRSFDLSDMEGRWFVYSSELNHDSAMDDARVKAVTGGDGLHVEAKYDDGRDMDTRCGVWLAGNNFPRLLRPDEAMRRRTFIFPCKIAFKEDDDGVVKDIGREIVEAEGPAIMATLLCWRAEYLREGLYRSPEMIAKRDEVILKDDKCESFLDEQALFNPDAATTLCKDVYTRYRGWCLDNGHKPEGRNEFYARLMSHRRFRENGCSKRKVRLLPHRSDGGRDSPQWVFAGLRLQPHPGFESIDETGTSVIGFPERLDTGST
jgi:P4 family phage/plasmid primase-like protien